MKVGWIGLEAEMAHLYQGGLSQRDIADKLGVAQSTVGRRLKKLGIEARTPSRPHEDRDGVLGKSCNICLMWHPLTEFYYHKGTLDNLEGRCKDCNRIRARERERAKLQTLDGKQKNRERNRRWYLKHGREYERRRRANDLNYRLKKNLRGQLRKAVRGDNRKASVLNLIGCSIDDLRIHLESQFQTGMTWRNYGKFGWEIDHIRPCASFDLIDPDQQRQCFHYTNLQPLWGTDNWSKGAKW